MQFRIVLFLSLGSKMLMHKGGKISCTTSFIFLYRKISAVVQENLSTCTTTEDYLYNYG